MHKCVGKLTTIGSDNGLSSDRRQAIIRTNAGILSIGPLGTKFCEILIQIQKFSLTKIRLKNVVCEMAFCYLLPSGTPPKRRGRRSQGCPLLARPEVSPRQPPGATPPRTGQVPGNTTRESFWWRHGAETLYALPGLMLGLRPGNERRRYKVIPSLIGWTQT